MEQTSGSLTTSFAGTINADLTGSAIQFTGGSVIDANTNGNWEPMANGVAGVAPADFGARAANAFATAKAALRDIVLDATSGALPVTNGSFGSGGIVFGFVTNRNSALDCLVTGLISANGRQKLNGLSTNRVSTAATLATNGGTLTLTMPVSTDFFFSLLSNNDTKITLTGKFVATVSAAPPLTVSPATVHVQSGIVSFQWQASSGQTFRVEGSPDLQTWTTRASGITSATSTYMFSGTATGTKEYFRLVR